MELREISIVYNDGSKVKKEIREYDDFYNEDMKVSVEEENKQDGKIVTIKLFSNKDINLQKFRVSGKIIKHKGRMMVNGFQSWTESRELGSENRLRKVNAIFKRTLEPYGDYGFYRYPDRIGILHSFTYTYIRGKNKDVLFLGSVNERTGYTIFEMNYRKNEMNIIKECEGVISRGEYEILKIYVGIGDINKVFYDYYSYYNVGREKRNKLIGWTSWYNYYMDITEEKIVKNLNLMMKENIPLDIFQIDDGYETAVGDWLESNEKFPSGMSSIAKKIKSAGYKPGIWISPFICEKKSTIFKEHPQWIVKNSKGKPMKVGINFGWSGSFYALDYYNEEVRNYLRRVFNTFFNKWGYEMVKLDFLYAAAPKPRYGKSRGEIMCEVMRFLSEIIGSNIVLACGVPLGPAFKQVDYCRVGTDTSVFWESKKLKLLKYREIISTFNSLRTIIERARLNKYAFLIDPDVFILRKSRNKLNENQKYTLFIINNLLGGIVTFSDSIEEYSEEEMKLLKSMFPKVEPNILKINKKRGVYRIDFSINENKYILYSNFTRRDVEIYVEDEMVYSRKEFIVSKGEAIILKPWESRCLYIIDTSGNINFVGSSGHLFSGGEIKKIDITEDECTVTLKKGIDYPVEVYFYVKDNSQVVKINSKLYGVQRIDGYRIVKVVFKGVNRIDY